jgi:hypothetical protein
MPVFSPAIAAIPNPGSFWQIAQYLGIDSNMQWCLDAADIASMPSSSDQTWLNRGASSLNWIRGGSTSASSDDPAFNGTAGDLKAATYFSFDGGDFFLQTNSGGAQPSFMQRIHADNALFAMAFWCQFASISAINGLISTFDGNTGVRGSYFRVTSGATLQLLIGRGSGGTYVLNAESAATIPTGRPVFLAVAVDEATGTGIFQIDGTQESFTSTYTTPSSGTFGAAIRVGSSSGTSHRFENGNRMFGWWLRESATLTATQLMALYKRSRMRPGF